MANNTNNLIFPWPGPPPRRVCLHSFDGNSVEFLVANSNWRDWCCLQGSGCGSGGLAGLAPRRGSPGRAESAHPHTTARATRVGLCKGGGTPAGPTTVTAINVRAVFYSNQWAVFCRGGRHEGEERAHVPAGGCWCIFKLQWASCVSVCVSVCLLPPRTAKSLSFQLSARRRRRPTWKGREQRQRVVCVRDLFVRISSLSSAPFSGAVVVFLFPNAVQVNAIGGRSAGSSSLASFGVAFGSAAARELLSSSSSSSFLFVSSSEVKK